MKLFMKKYQKLLLAVVVLVCAAGVLTGVLLYRENVRKQEKERQLAESLQGIWIRSVEEDANTHLELFVTQGTMDYNFRNARYPEYDQTLLTYGWEIFDSESIELRYPEGGKNLIQVTFTPASGDTPEQVTFSPAITSTEDTETWERSTP